MLMREPSCTTGGSASIRLIRASTSPLLLRPFRHRLARIVPTTRTVSDVPGCTRMLPDPDDTDTSTVPLTLSVRSNLPSSWAAVASAGAAASPRATTSGGAGLAAERKMSTT